MATIHLPPDFKELLKLFNARQIVRMGLPPIRIEIVTTISGVQFQECYAEKVVANLDGVEVNLISLKHLKINKKASGKYKDLNDLENLP
jgi:hypothetical protein